MNGDSKSFFEGFKDDLTDYLHAKAQLTKIQASEKLAKISGVVFSLIVLLMLSGFVIIFIGLMLGYWLGELTHSYAIGFSIVAGLWVLLLIILVVKRRNFLEIPFTEKVIDVLFEDEEEHTFNNPD